MLTSKNQAFRALILLAVWVFFVSSCSSNGSSDAEPAAQQDAADEASSADVSNGVATSDSNASPTAAPSAVPSPSLSDEDLASVTNLQAGSQVEDAQGNLIAIYGVAEWSAAFEALTAEARAGFSFFGDVDDLVDPSLDLMAIDIGFCAAGIDSVGAGTAEFFVHRDVAEVLSVNPVIGRGVLARHPVTHPGFAFPSPAECRRGWLPVLWGDGDAPGVARYVLATRAGAGSSVERHVYQWEIDMTAPDVELDDESLFGPGQTVTFNDGNLTGTTVKVDGWAELIGVDTGVAGARAVAVSLTFCPSSNTLPQFGLSVDGWNIVAPAPGDTLFGALTSSDVTQSCFDGWLQFAVPFGGVPTGFFASDGVDSVNGYSQWSLLQAALPAPQ